MNRFFSLRPIALVLLATIACAMLTPFAAGDQPLGELKVKSFSLSFGEDGFAVLRMTGTAPDLGNCACCGELVFAPGEDEDTLDGLGVVVFTAANGDILVGVIAAQIDTIDQTFAAQVRWRDSVTVRNGATIASSGRFARHRPTGMQWQLISHFD